MNRIPFERLVELAEGSRCATAREKSILSQDSEAAKELEELRDVLAVSASIKIPEQSFAGIDNILPEVMQSIERKNNFSIWEFLPAPKLTLGMAASCAAILFIYFAVAFTIPSYTNEPFGYLASMGAEAEEIIYPYSSMELVAMESSDSELNFKNMADVDSTNLENYQQLSQDSEYSFYDEISNLEEESFNSLIDELDEK